MDMRDRLSAAVAGVAVIVALGACVTLVGCTRGGAGGASGASGAGGAGEARAGDVARGEAVMTPGSGVGQTSGEIGGDGARAMSGAGPVVVRAQPSPDAAVYATREGAGAGETAKVEDGGGLREFLPHVRIDVGARVVEFDGTVPIDAHAAGSPRVYLELLACSRDTREHESLVVTDASPSSIHAALLAIGLEPGAPGTYEWQGERPVAVVARGPRVRVTVVVERDGKEVEEALGSWAKTVRDGRSFEETLAGAGGAGGAGGGGLVFAGSVTAERNGVTRYMADGAGTIVGLTTFGTEVVAPTAMYNPDAGVEEPHWIADASRVPKFGTAVRVRIRVE